MTEFAQTRPVETLQPPYSLFRRDIEADVLPYTRAHDIGVLVYGPLAHGLLTGTMDERTTFAPDDWRSTNPSFHGETFRHNLEKVRDVQRFASEELGTSVAQLAVAWTLAEPGRSGGDRRRPTPPAHRRSRRRQRTAPRRRRPRTHRPHHGRRDGLHRPVARRRCRHADDEPSSNRLCVQELDDPFRGNPTQQYTVADLAGHRAGHSGGDTSHVDTIWDVINWSDVADRFAHACHGRRRPWHAQAGSSTKYETWSFPAAPAGTVRSHHCCSD